VSRVATSADVTGEAPLAMFVRAKASDELGGFREQLFGWSGCLDAPALMPAGSVIPVNIAPEVGGMGYEGNVSRLVDRDGAAS
jgi:hypothetical protein